MWKRRRKHKRSATVFVRETIYRAVEPWEKPRFWRESLFTFMPTRGAIMDEIGCHLFSMRGRNFSHLRQAVGFFIRRTSAVVLFSLGGIAPSHAFEWLENTSLASVRVGAGLSQTASEIGRGGFELSDGSAITFRQWYEPDIKSLEMLFITPLNDNFGVYWGFNTGENGEKYWIDPSIKIGFIARFELTPSSQISFSVTGIVGGYLEERSCIADYGAIGGIQAVNCRLAASPLPPSETLNYLLRIPPPEQIKLTLRYTARF